MQDLHLFAQPSYLDRNRKFFGFLGAWEPNCRL